MDVYKGNFNRKEQLEISNLYKIEIEISGPDQLQTSKHNIKPFNPSCVVIFSQLEPILFIDEA